MSEKDYAPLSMACVRGLCDKIYEKRKFAGAEVEKMVKDFSEANNASQVRRLVRVLLELLTSTNANVKVGALMGLSSVAVGLGKGCAAHLEELVGAGVACCGEAESRVRYAAVEALFNVVKMARGAALAHFPALFDALARLAADPEPQVRQGAELLDRLLKDIATESGAAFDVAAFVPLVRERLYARGAGARQFAAGWVSALDAAPHTRLAAHLPDLLDPLLHMLDDPNPEIRRMCEVQLGEWERGLCAGGGGGGGTASAALCPVLAAACRAPAPAVRGTALRWLRALAAASGCALLPHAAALLLAALPCLALSSPDDRSGIRESAAAVNMQLLQLVGAEAERGDENGSGDERKGEDEGENETARKGGLDVPGVVGALTQLLAHGSVHTKVAALDWVLHLYAKLPAQMFAQTEQLFASALATLTDPADDVVRRGLAVLAEICSCRVDAPPGEEGGGPEASEYYAAFLRELLRLLAEDEAFLEERGALVVRQLCGLLGGEAVLRALAAGAARAPPRFAATMADLLAGILLTAAELYDLRCRLRHFDDPATHALFLALHGCWSHGPAALLALALLTRSYGYAARLVHAFGELEITVDFLTELDKLVQLLESPVFAFLRLELLGGPGAAELRAALGGLLMLLPQSEAFHTLRRRLQCAPPALVAPAVAPPDAPPAIDYDALLEEFRRVQAARRRPDPRDPAYS